MNENRHIDVEFLKDIFKYLSKEPDDILIERRVDEMGVLLEISAPKVDASILIGRQGKNVEALRVLLKALGAINGARYNLKISGIEEKSNG